MSSYDGSGGYYTKKCIVCGGEFEATRSHAKFCPSAACRQAFSRRQRALRRLLENAQACIDSMSDLAADDHLGKQAQDQLIVLENELTQHLDAIAPQRKPRPVNHSTLIQVQPAIGDVTFLIGEGGPVKVRLLGRQDAWLRARLGDTNEGWTRDEVLIPPNSTFVKIVDPDSDNGQGY